MTLVRFSNPYSGSYYRPENQIRNLFNALNGIQSSNCSSRNLPPANIIEGEDHYKIQLAVPGYKKEDFNIELEKSRLKISLHQEEAGRDVNFTLKEFGYDNFERSYQLSENIDSEKIEAVYEDGILEIKLFKHDKANLVKTIKVA